MTPELKALLEKAKNHVMTPEERFDQKISFVYGQLLDSSSTLTKEQIRQRVIKNESFLITAHKFSQADVEAVARYLCCNKGLDPDSIIDEYGPVLGWDAYALTAHAALSAIGQICD